jgi:tetrapyrrole methylase family protein/MazG family protein/ATP diphosphatase
MRRRATGRARALRPLARAGKLAHRRCNPPAHKASTAQEFMVSRSFQVPDRAPLDEQQGQTFPKLVQLMQRLLAPDGCPWDREQTITSLRRYVLEEACEVIDAIDTGEGPLLEEELGDLLLQVVFLAEMGRKAHGFGPDDVVRGICEKLVRRHPHVFAEAVVANSDDVARQWESIKAEEKPGRRGLLDKVPRSLPALERAHRLSDRVSRVGFDWPDATGSRAKVQEELAELDAAIADADPTEIEAELGDLLFAVVNLARQHGIDASAALQQTNERFTRRFAHVERRVHEQLGGWPLDAEGKPGAGIPLERLDAFWNEAKALAKKEAP